MIKNCEDSIHEMYLYNVGFGVTNFTQMYHYFIFWFSSKYSLFNITKHPCTLLYVTVGIPLNKIYMESCQGHKVFLTSQLAGSMKEQQISSYPRGLNSDRNADN